MKKLLGLVLALMLLCSAALATELSPVAEGQEASDFEVTLSDGTTFKLSDHRGKAVLVNLWATWCPPCVGEMPDLQKLSEDYADTLVVLGVNVGDTAEAAAAFMEENGYTYPLYVDADYALSMDMFPSPYIPFTVVIDPNGVVTTIHSGGGEDMYDVFKGYVDEALAGAEAAEPAADAAQPADEAA